MPCRQLLCFVISATSFKEKTQRRPKPRGGGQAGRIFHVGKRARARRPKPTRPTNRTELKPGQRNDSWRVASQLPLCCVLLSFFCLFLLVYCAAPFSLPLLLLLLHSGSAPLPPSREKRQDNRWDEGLAAAAAAAAAAAWGKRTARTHIHSRPANHLSKGILRKADRHARCCCCCCYPFPLSVLRHHPGIIRELPHVLVVNTHTHPLPRP